MGSITLKPPGVEPATDLKITKGCDMNVCKQMKDDRKHEPTAVGRVPGDKGHRKGQVLNSFFNLVFTGKICLKNSQTCGNVWNKVFLGENQIREYLNKLERQ